MEDKWFWLEKILDNIIDIAENAEKSTPDGSVIPDYKTRRDANLDLLQMAGIYKKKWNDINFNLDLTKLLYQ